MSEFRERRFTSQDGLSLYYRDYGDPLAAATPVLCLPGLARNSKDFHRVARRLSPRRRVICLDYRGRGQSDYDPDPRRYDPATYLGDVHHLLAAAGVHRVAVIGTSLGGLLATGMGAAMPTVLAGVAMNDVGPDVPRDGLGRIITYLSQENPLPDWETAVAEMQRMLPTLSFRTHEEWLYAAQATWRACDDGMLRFDWDPRIIDSIRDNKPVQDLWPLFRSLRHLPVLVVRGGVSDVLSAATLDRMAQVHPNLQRITLEGVGHTPSLFEPESETAIDRWLKAIDEAAANRPA